MNLDIVPLLACAGLLFLVSLVCAATATLRLNREIGPAGYSAALLPATFGGFQQSVEERRRRTVVLMDRQRIGVAIEAQLILSTLTEEQPRALAVLTGE